MYLASLSKYGQVNMFIPELINQYNSVTVSAINEKVFLLEWISILLRRIDGKEGTLLGKLTINKNSYFLKIFR